MQCVPVIFRFRPGRTAKKRAFFPQRRKWSSRRSPPFFATVRAKASSSSVSGKGKSRSNGEGDYRLRLSFSEGRALPGILGIASAEGRVETFTRRIGCSIGKNSVLLALRYTLRLEGGDREMRIRLSARNKGEPEEK